MRHRLLAFTITDLHQVFAKPTDHGGEVVVKTKPEFDLDQTIFQTLPRGAKGFFPRKIVAHRLGVDLFWDDAVAVKIQSAYASVPRAPKHDQCILDFMRDECNFNTEHADGTAHSQRNLHALTLCLLQGRSWITSSSAMSTARPISRNIRLVFCFSTRFLEWAPTSFQ